MPDYTKLLSPEAQAEQAAKEAPYIEVAQTSYRYQMRALLCLLAAFILFFLGFWIATLVGTLVLLVFVYYIARAALASDHQIGEATEALGRVRGRWIISHLKGQTHTIWWALGVILTMMAIGFGGGGLNDLSQVFSLTNVARWLPFLTDGRTTFVFSLTAYAFWFAAIVTVLRILLGRRALTRQKAPNFVW